MKCESEVLVWNWFSACMLMFFMRPIFDKLDRALFSFSGLVKMRKCLKLISSLHVEFYATANFAVTGFLFVCNNSTYPTSCNTRSVQHTWCVSLAKKLFALCALQPFNAGLHFSAFDETVNQRDFLFTEEPVQQWLVLTLTMAMRTAAVLTPSQVHKLEKLGTCDHTSYLPYLIIVLTIARAAAAPVENQSWFRS